MGLLSGLFGGGGGGGGTSTGGFFGSGGKTSTSQSYSETNTSQSTVSENEGAAIAGGDNNTILYTDFNAIDRATELAAKSLDAANDTSQYAIDAIRDYSGDALLEVSNFARNFGDSAFSTVEKALSGVAGAYQDSAAYQSKALTAVSDANANALEAVQDTNQNALDSVGNLFKSAFQGITDFVGDLQERAQNQLGDTVTALNEIAVENSKSTDQRVAEISENAIKYVIWGVGILVVGGGLVALATTWRKS